MSDPQQSLEKFEAGQWRPPYWLFPSVILSAVIFTIGLFWFSTVVLNQFSNANRGIDLSYTPAKEIARLQGKSAVPVPDTYMKAGEYQKALALLEPSIRILKATGKQDALLADNLQAAGKCYFMLNKYVEAEQYYREAINIYDKLGSTYPRKLRREAERDYAAVLKRLGQNEQARQFETRED
jgi:tetratricopeptide (TPR) repeat protein